MSNGWPNPLELYAIAEYQYPLVDEQPVVRIPIVGPEPFNTLVVVRGQVGITNWRYADGKLQRRKISVGTNFHLVGFDPRVPALAKHSTSAAIQMLQSSDDTSFVSAIDAVDDGFFDEVGRWTVVVRVADLWDNTVSASMAYISSWVLCYEPPLDPHAAHGVTPFRRYASNTLSHLLEIEAKDPTAAGANIDHYVKRSARNRQQLPNNACATNNRSRSNTLLPMTSNTYQAQTDLICPPKK